VNNVASVNRTRPTAPSGYYEFGVKNIAFTHETYPADDPWKYSTNDLDTSVTGIPGQNEATPKAKLFVLHYNVHRTGDSTYYDPSYGTTSAGPEEFTPPALHAWAQWMAGVLHWRTLGSDPTVDPVYVLFTDL